MAVKFTTVRIRCKRLRYDTNDTLRIPPVDEASKTQDYRVEVFLYWSHSTSSRIKQQIGSYLFVCQIRVYKSKDSCY